MLFDTEEIMGITLFGDQLRSAGSTLSTDPGSNFLNFITDAAGLTGPDGTKASSTASPVLHSGASTDATATTVQKIASSEIYVPALETAAFFVGTPIKIGPLEGTFYGVVSPGAIASGGVGKGISPFMSFKLDRKVVELLGSAAVVPALLDGSPADAARGALPFAALKFMDWAKEEQIPGVSFVPMVTGSMTAEDAAKLFSGTPHPEGTSSLPPANYGLGALILLSGKNPTPLSGKGAVVFFNVNVTPDNDGTYAASFGVIGTGIKPKAGMPDLNAGVGVTAKVKFDENASRWDVVLPDGSRAQVPKEFASILDTIFKKNSAPGGVSVSDLLAMVGIGPKQLETMTDIASKAGPPLAEGLEAAGTLSSFGLSPLVGIPMLTTYLIEKGNQLDEATTRKLAGDFITQGGLSPSKLAAQLPAEMSTPELNATAFLLSKAIDLHLEGNPGDREKLKDIWSAAANGKDTRLAYLGKIVTGDLRGAAELAILRGDPLAHIDAISPLKGLASSLAPDERTEGYAGAQTPRGDYAQVAVGILPEKAAFAVLSPPVRNLPPVELSGSTLAEAQQEARQLIEKEEGDITNYYQPVPGKPPLETPAPAENFLDRPTTVSHRPAVVLGLGTMKVVEDTTNGKFFAVGKVGQPYPVEPARYPDEAIATAQQMMLDGRIPKDDVIPEI